MLYDRKLVILSLLTDLLIISFVKWNSLFVSIFLHLSELWILPNGHDLRHNCRLFFQKGFVEAHADDGLLEIFGLKQGWHASFVMVELISAKHIAQVSL